MRQTPLVRARPAAGHLATAAVVWVASLGPASVVHAEDPLLLAKGTRIRVSSLALRSPIVGTLTAVDEDSLTVGAGNQRLSTRVARADISRLERSMQPSRKRRGALIGLGVGFGLGLTGTFVLCESYGTSCPAGEGLVFGSLYGAGVAVVGALVGVAVSPGERWADVPTEGLRFGAGREKPNDGVPLTIVPLVGRQRGLRLVASF